MQRVITTLCLLACALIFVTGANGQENLNFATRIPRGLSGRNLPPVNMPSPAPNGYGQLDRGPDFNLNQCVFGVPGFPLGSSAFQAGDDGEGYRFVRKWGKQAPAGTFNLPTAVTVDSNGNMFIFDALDYRVEKFDMAGNFLLTWGMLGSERGEFF